MPFVTRKISDYGTENPIVARVAFQWMEILPWFELSEARRTSVLESLLLKVQPRLLACVELSTKLKADVEMLPVSGAGAAGLLSPEAELRAKNFVADGRQALDEFARVFAPLLGRNAPERNYAALGKWAEKWFSPEDRLTRLLVAANSAWIRRFYAVSAGFGQSGTGIVAAMGMPPAAVLSEFETFNAKIVPFIEEAIMAALMHVPSRAPVTFVEIPEAERDNSAPIRFRAMSEAGNGKLVPAGRVSKSGNVVPELQRLLQQGRGRPIIATKFHGEWFVASGAKLHHSPRWKNFHDFLGDYIKDILGGPWANPELKKPREERHPFMLWYGDVTTYTNAFIKEGKGAPMTSLPAAYLGLAYNLYLISHNNGKVHEVLIRRLQHRDQFYGAYFEAAVAGMMIRAGFDIEFEDEAVGTTKHCEFTATHRESGQKLSVEAKMRHSKQQPPQIRWLLGAALQKKANHPRLVFIEVNDEECSPESQKKLLLDLLATVRGKEADLLVEGQPAPPAYLVITNNPPATVNRPHTPAYMVEGFKISDFRVEGFHASVHDALEARKRHIAMFTLVDSLHENNRIPVTFDGEVQAFASEPPHGRLLIGSNYRIDTPNGEVAGVLQQAIVMPPQKCAFCCLRGADGQQRMVTVPLSDQEMQAYHESPRTFFGREEPETKITDPLKFYDVMHACYKQTPKERLLELFAESGAHDVEALKALTQEKLAEIFAERMTNSVMVTTGSAVAETQPG